jgi:putative membrane protein
MKMLKKFPLILLLVAIGACKDDDDKKNLSQRDRNFTMSAAYANLAEIDAGQLASSKSTEQNVKDFGAHMADEHTTAWNDLKALSRNKNVNLPDQPDSAHQQKKNQLMSLEGYTFDTAYVNSQVKDHLMAISLFQQAQTNSDDKDVKAYAVKYLPHLQEHLTSALALKADLETHPQSRK